MSFRRLWPVLFVIFSHLFMNFRRRWWGDIFMATWYDDLCRGRWINSLLFLGMMESRRWRWWWWVSNSGRWDYNFVWLVNRLFSLSLWGRRRWDFSRVMFFFICMRNFHGCFWWRRRWWDTLFRKWQVGLLASMRLLD